MGAFDLVMPLQFWAMTRKSLSCLGSKWFAQWWWDRRFRSVESLKVVGLVGGDSVAGGVFGGGC